MELILFEMPSYKLGREKKKKRMYLDLGIFYLAYMEQKSVSKSLPSKMSQGLQQILSPLKSGRVPITLKEYAKYLSLPPEVFRIR